MEDVYLELKKGMPNVIEHLENKIKEFSIPLIKGEIYGTGHTLIKVLLPAFLESSWKDVEDSGSLAVLDVNYEETEEGIGDIIGYKLYIRLGKTNTWLYSDFSLISDEEDDDYYDDEFERVDTETISRMALITARHEKFGILKNKSLRQDFVVNLLKKSENSGIDEFYAEEIASRAENIFEFGVLPEKVKKLKDEGKDLSEIAKLLGFTRNRVERALANGVMDGNISELLNKYPE